MVYVISIDNKPLMPTNRHGKVRRLLRDNKAKVVKRTPFTINFYMKQKAKSCNPLRLVWMPVLRQ